MHGSSVSLHNTASACGCHALGCRRACLVLAVPEDRPALGDWGSLPAQEVRDGGSTALVSCVAGGGDSLVDKAGVWGVLQAPRPEPFGHRGLCTVCPPQEWLAARVAPAPITGGPGQLGCLCLAEQPVLHSCSFHAQGGHGLVWPLCATESP